MHPIITPPATPAPLTPDTPGRSPSLTDVQAASVTTWIKEDLAQGKITPEQAAKAFDEINAPVEARADTRSDEVKDLDTAFPPAPTPAEYTINYGRDLTPGDKQFDTAARTWLHAAEFPAHLGTTLAKTIDDVTRTTAGMSEDQLADYGHRELVKLQHLYGDTLEARLNAAGRMVNEIEAKQPGLKQLLKSRGIGDAARVAVLLMDQAERYGRRRTR